MSWNFKKAKSKFPDLITWRSDSLRLLLDLQYASLLRFERQYLKDFKALKILELGPGENSFAKRMEFSDYKSVDPYYPATFSSIDQVPSNSKYDLVVALEVLEHVQNSEEVVAILSSFQDTEDWLYISTPFLAREHGAPEDFYRWTEFGLRTLLTKNGYKVMQLKRRGNLLAVVSSLINYWAFSNLKTRYFFIALLLLPLIPFMLILSHISLRLTLNSSFYLGLSVIAKKV